MRTRRAELALAASFLIAGCGDTMDRVDLVVRDTVIAHEGADVSVQIVESPVDTAALERWQVGGTPMLDIGAISSPEQVTLFRVAGAYRLSGGRIVVADGGSSALLVFSSDGRLERTVGGPGEGPGEFRGLTHFARLPGDSLGVWDIANGRLTVFTAEGTRARDMRIGATPSSPRSNVIGVLADGSLLSRGFVDLGGAVPDGLERHNAALLHLHSDGALADSIGTIPGSEAFFESFDGGFSFYTVPFGRSTEIVAAGDRIYIGDSARPELLVRAPDGTPLRMIRWTQPSRPIRSSDVESARKHALAGMDASRSAGIERMFAALEMPETMPAFGSVRADADGNVWIQQYRTAWDEGSSMWLVFDDEGAVRGWAELPARFTPTDIGTDYVLGITRDHLDLEYVQLFRLTRTET